MVRKAKTEMQLSNCLVASRQLLSCNSPIALLQLHFFSAMGGLRIGQIGRGRYKKKDLGGEVLFDG